MALGAVLLLPLTLVTALLLVVSYRAYPPPGYPPVQLAFDGAMLLQTAALVAAWRLVLLGGRGGGSGLSRAHPVWLALVGAGALVGLGGVAIAAEHMMNPQRAHTRVGFALLAPAAALALVWLQLYWTRRSLRR